MNATPVPSVAAHPSPSRQAAAYVAFGLIYFALAAGAASLPLHRNLPMFIWPAHGLALGVLLVAPMRRWPVYLAMALFAALAIEAMGDASPAGVLAVGLMSVLAPLAVALGLGRLAGPRVQVDTVKGLAALLIGMVPLVAGVAMADAAYAHFAYGAALRQQWSLDFISMFVAMVLIAPLILAWSRRGYREALVEARLRMPELVVLFAGLVITAGIAFAQRPQGEGSIPPLAYLCAPFLIWAALRFGLRAATLGLAVFGLICYWYTGQVIVQGPTDAMGEVRPLLYLQFYVLTIVIMSLFSAALHVEREEAARETEEWRYRHERVIRASQSLLYDFDPNTGQVVWDGDVQSVIGTSGDRVATARQWMERVHPEDRQRLKGLRKQLLEGEISHIAMEYRLRRDDGRYSTVGVNAYLVGEARKGSEVRRVIGFVKDVSDKVRAEEEKLRLEVQLRQAEKMQAVGHLAGGIAHDFNNILGAILGYGELAQAKAQGDADMSRYLDTIMGAGNRAKALVTQILSYSRAEGAEKIPVIVGPIVQEACELVRGSASRKVDVRFHLESPDAAVLGDPTRLHQLVMNLCTNAIQAMSEDGSIDLTVAREELRAPRKVRTGEISPGDYVRLSVKDSGHGIAPEVIDRIFEPFFTTKPAGRGTGLGLALVHSVVMEHKGFIDVESELGRGTTFNVWMPQIQGEIGPVTEQRRDELPRGNGQQVLAVDDEPEVLAALEEMLATLGYEPAGFRNGREALAAVRENPRRFEAVVSDEVMPELTGTQMALELRRINPKLPILIASGYGGSGFEARALAAGVNRVLKKPYRMSEIAEVLAGFFAARP
jgi:PAS domain S-box-containing protein